MAEQNLESVIILFKHALDEDVFDYVMQRCASWIGSHGVKQTVR